MAMAQRAQDIRSPVDRSMSISRGSGLGETSSAMAISSSVVLPRALKDADDALPVLAGADHARGGALDALRVGDGGAAELHHHGARHRRAILGSLLAGARWWRGCHRRRRRSRRPTATPLAVRDRHRDGGADRRRRRPSRAPPRSRRAARFRRAAQKLPARRSASAQLMVVGFEGDRPVGAGVPRAGRPRLGRHLVGPDNAFDLTASACSPGEARPWRRRERRRRRWWPPSTTAGRRSWVRAAPRPAPRAATAAAAAQRARASR